MNKRERVRQITDLALQGLGRPAILQRVPGATEWEVRSILAKVKEAPVDPAVPVEEGPRSPSMKILGIDIETAPHLVHVWGLFNQNIAPIQIIQPGRTLCFAYKWLNQPKSPIEFVSEFHDGHEEMVNAAWELLNEADAVVHFNGAQFDVPSLNTEFIKHKLTPPAPYKQIDLLLTVRKQFRFASNKLAHLLVDLKIGRKVDTGGHELWIKCLEGDPVAWKTMETYNVHDVRELEKLYNMLLPWISSHPNHALYFDPGKPVCPNCGSHHLHSRGTAFTKLQEYRRFCCKDCGTWSRERLNTIPQAKRRKILTQSL